MSLDNLSCTEQQLFFLHVMCYAFQDFLCPTHFQRNSFHSKVNSITLHLNLVVFSLFSPHSLIHLLILDLLTRGENTHRLSATLLPVYILRSSILSPDDPLFRVKTPAFLWQRMPPTYICVCRKSCSHRSPWHCSAMVPIPRLQHPHLAMDQDLSTNKPP